MTLACKWNLAFSVEVKLSVTMAGMVARGATAKCTSRAGYSRIIAVRGGALFGRFLSFATPYAITTGLLATALLAVLTLTVSLLGVPDLPGPFFLTAMIAAVTLQRINR